MTPRVLLPLLCAVTGGAATIDVSDLRVGLGAYGIANQSWNEQYSAGPWSVLPSDSGSGGDWDGEVFGAFSVMYTRGHLPRGGGFIWGVGFESDFESHSSEVLGFAHQTVATSTFAFVGRVGFGLPIGPRVHLEFMPELHLGWVDTDVYDTDGYVLERTTAVGGYVAGGLHVGGYVTVDRALVLGASFGVRRCAADYDATFASTGGHVDGSLYYTQWGGQFECGVRF